MIHVLMKKWHPVFQELCQEHHQLVVNYCCELMGTVTKNSQCMKWTQFTTPPMVSQHKYHNQSTYRLQIRQACVPLSSYNFMFWRLHRAQKAFESYLQACLQQGKIIKTSTWNACNLNLAYNILEQGGSASSRWCITWLPRYIMPKIYSFQRAQICLEMNNKIEIRLQKRATFRYKYVLRG